jgi:hypothetical protein
MVDLEKIARASLEAGIAEGLRQNRIDMKTDSTLTDEPPRELCTSCGQSKAAPKDTVCAFCRHEIDALWPTPAIEVATQGAATPPAIREPEPTDLPPPAYPAGSYRHPYGPDLYTAEQIRAALATPAPAPPAPSEPFDHAHPDSWKYEAQSLPAVPPATEPAPTHELVHRGTGKVHRRAAWPFSIDSWEERECFVREVAPAKVSGEERATGADPVTEREKCEAWIRHSGVTKAHRLLAWNAWWAALQARPPLEG